LTSKPSSRERSQTGVFQRNLLDTFIIFMLYGERRPAAAAKPVWGKPHTHVRRDGHQARRGLAQRTDDGHPDASGWATTSPTARIRTLGHGKRLHPRRPMPPLAHPLATMHRRRDSLGRHNFNASTATIPPALGRLIQPTAPRARATARGKRCDGRKAESEKRRAETRRKTGLKGGKWEMRNAKMRS